MIYCNETVSFSLMYNNVKSNEIHIYHVTSTEPLTEQLKMILKKAEISLHRQTRNIFETTMFDNDMFDSTWSAHKNLMAIPSFF